MTRKELETIFSFPSGIDETYRRRQDAVSNIIYQLYEVMGLKIPKVYFFKSPLVLQMAINYLPQNNSNFELGTDSPLLNEYPDFSYALFNDHIVNRTRNLEFWDFVSNKIAGLVSSKVKDSKQIMNHLRKYLHLANVIDDTVSTDLHNKLSRQGMTYFGASHHPHFTDICWLSAHQHFIHKLTQREKDVFLLYYDLIKNGMMYAWLLQDVVLWCPLPAVLHLNTMNQFHNSHEPALKWNDGYELHFWNGRKVRKRLIEYPESITRLDILEERDPEMRQCMREKLGPHRYASLFQLVELDSDRDPAGKMQYLYRTSHVDDLSGDYIYFARLTNPLDGKSTFLYVPAGMTNVWDAVAWAFPSGRGNYSTLVEA